MGAGPSLDGEASEAKRVIAEFLEKFTKNYGTLYLAGLAQESIHQQKKVAAGPKWDLLKCEDHPPPPDRKSGHMLKRSKHLKKWNKRFFIVRGNWMVDYWEKEDDHKADKKPRGTINMSGLRVVRDPNDTALNKIVKLAEKCKLNIDDFPKPEQLPDFTMELAHDRKDSILLQCENADDFKAWCDIMDDCRWYAPSLTIQDDKIHKKVFKNALWRTRWQTGLWGWWYGGGGEEAYLSDCINEAVMDAVMPSVDAKLTMPWAVRSKVRNSFAKQVDVAVSAAVKPAWKGLYEGTLKARAEAEPKIAESVSPIGEQQVNLQSKIMEQVDEPSKKVMGESVMPHLSPLLDIVFAPVNQAYKILLVAYDTALSRGRENYKPNEKHLYMVRHHSWNGDFWDADRKLSDLYEPLWNMRKVFEDVSPWNITGKARRRLRKLMKNALFTFETNLEAAGGVEHWDRVAAETRVTLIKDCRSAIMRSLGHILCGVVEEFWEKMVIRPARKLVEPIADLVPDALKTFLDVQELLVETLNNVLAGACANVFQPFTDRIEL